MKKIVQLLIVILLIVLFASCSEEYADDWKKIEIDDCGILAIPSDWIFFEEDGYYYITDQNDVPIMIQTYSNVVDTDMDKINSVTESNKYYDDVKEIKSVRSEVLSNGVCYGVSLMRRDGKDSERYMLELYNDKTVVFVVWSDTVTEELLVKIAKSFEAK